MNKIKITQEMHKKLNKASPLYDSQTSTYGQWEITSTTI